MRNPIIVALDVPTTDAALKLVEQLAQVAGGFKVGSELFTSAGPDIVRRIRGEGGYHGTAAKISSAVDG